jgi:hypothetical protein
MAAPGPRRRLEPEEDEGITGYRMIIQGTDAGGVEHGPIFSIHSLEMRIRITEGIIRHPSGYLSLKKGEVYFERFIRSN